MSIWPSGVGNDSRRIRFRVRYPEVDRMGVVYHAHYLEWFEMGRTELMRGLGCTYADLEQHSGVFFPVREAGARYHASARYDDELTVATTLTHLGGASVRFDYRVLRGDPQVVLATGFTEHAAVGRDGRPIRIPADTRKKLAGEEKRR